jgi:hypothetical protein
VTDWDLALKVLQLVLWAMVGAYTWQQARHRATREHVEHLEREVGELRREHGVLAERVRHLPTAREVAELTGAVRELGAKFSGVESGQAAALVRLSRIEDYLHKVT